MRRAACLLFLVCSLTACHGSPRERPLQLAPIGSGPGSLEAARKSLAGLWDLRALETFPASGAPVTVEANARMSFDHFGNVKISAVREPSSTEAQRLLDYSGQVVIDPQRQEWRLVSITAGKAAVEQLLPEVAPDKIRAYELKDDMLMLTMRDASGRKTASSTWQRVKP